MEPLSWLFDKPRSVSFVSFVAERQPPLPVALFGHSLGAMVAFVAADRLSARLACVVLSGFALVGSVVVGGVLGHLVMMDLCQYSSLGTPPVSALAGSTPDLDVTVERSTVLGLALAEPKRALRLRDSVVLGPGWWL